jgi:RHS repeat-associated protein
MKRITTLFGRASALAALCLGLLASPATAQQHANQARGFNANGVYQQGDVDSVNLFNGNLTVDIPIGQTYSTNDGFSYRLRLVYNSNLWNFREVCQGGVNFSYSGFYTRYVTVRIFGQLYLFIGRYDLIPSDTFPEGFRGGRGGDPNTDCSSFAYPNPSANAGHGWQLSLGRLYPPRGGAWSDTSPNINESGRWMYVSQDGSEHLFFPELHVEEAGGPTIPPPPDPAISYTRDGSFLRMTRVTDDFRTIEFPTGETHEFEKDGAGLWRLERIHDRFDNDLRIEYLANEWRLTDSTGRVHHVDFTNLGGGTSAVVDRIRVAKFGGGHAEYDFSYELNPTNGSRVFSIPRACPSSVLAGPTQVDVAFLESVTFPDGQRYRMPEYDKAATISSCEIQGVITKLETPTGSEVTWNYQWPTGSLFFDGTRGWVNGYTYPQGSSPRAYIRGTAGVRERKVYDPVRNQTDTWTYDPHLQCVDGGESLGDCFDFGFGQNNPETPAPEEFVNVVTSPDGTQTVNYFSVFPIGIKDLNDPESWNSADYGLPFTRRFSDVVGSRPLVYLSQEFFPPGVDPFPPRSAPGEPLPPRPTPQRASYVRYERDTLGYNVNEPGAFFEATDSGFGEHLLLNRRVVGERTVYFEAGNRSGHRDVWRSGYDGLGHYRSQTIEGDVAGAFANGPKGIHTQFNDGRGEYPGDFSQLPPTTPWLTELYTRIDRSQQGANTLSTLYCFDPATGFLDGTRRITNLASGEQAKDLVTRFEREEEVLDTSEGIRDTRITIRELRYGGDSSLGNAHTPAGCAGSTAAAAEFRTDRQFRWGALEAETWVNDFTGDGELVVVDLTVPPPGGTSPGIDRNTGLPLTSRGPDGLWSLYQYDDLGRPTRVTPQNNLDAVTAYEYQILSDGANEPAGAQVTTCKLPAGSTADCSSSQVIETSSALLDGLGRPEEDQRRYPCASGSCWAKQRHWFGFLGTPLTRQEHTGSWEPLNNIPAQTFWTKQRFDPFGRLVLVEEPRGGIWETLYEHLGATTTREANWIFEHVPGHADGGELSRLSRWTVRDVANRIVKVTELADESSTLAAITRYEYDADDQLTQVTLHKSDPDGEAGAIQNSRSFVYDGRGFMTREQHPELGSSGNGEVFYRYDSMGHILAKTYDNSTPTPGLFNLTYEYDRAGRLLRVNGQPTAESTSEVTLEERFYARQNSTPSGFGRFSGGKLVQAKRYNPEAETRVTETLVYDSPGGGLSKRQVRAVDVRGTLAYSQNFTYDALGNLLSQDYPLLDCPTGNCTGAPPSRNVTNSYQDGHLTKVEAVVNGQSLEVAKKITYHPNGLLNEVTHQTLNASGAPVVTWERLFTDPHGLPRPQQFQHVAAGGSGSALGPYDFDTAGNIFQIGSDRFAYDGAGRLQWVRQTVEEGCTSAPCIFEVEYDYDIPGNIQQVRQKEDGAVVARPVTPASTSTNRLIGGGTVYDRAGNITLWDNRMAFVYDPLNRIAAQGTQGAPKQMIYDADGERLVVKDYQLDASGAVQIWRLRGLNNEVLREVRRNADGTWSWNRDYLYRDKMLLAQLTPTTGGETLTHFYLDHLGTPRHTSGANGFIGGYREYLPFGEEITKPRHEQDFLQFTGHERDFNCLTGSGSACAEGSYQAKVDDLDYMHARFYSPWNARFLGVDPKLGALDSPQTWNRYSYTANNPVLLADQNGESATVIGGLLGGLTGGAVALVQGKSWREVGAAAAGGALAGAMLGSVIDTGGASLGVLVAAGATSSAAGGLLERAIAGKPNTVANVALDATTGAVSGLLAGSLPTAAVPATTSSKSSSTVVREGIYEFADQTAGGKPYVGQAVDVPARLAQHTRAGRLQPGTATTTEVTGGKLAREIAEHRRIQEITKGVPARQSPAVANKVDPIGPNRRHLLESDGGSRP